MGRWAVPQATRKSVPEPGPTADMVAVTVPERRCGDAGLENC